MSRPASYCHLTSENWDARIAAADALAVPCRLCPHECGVDRLAGETGTCGAPSNLRISSIFAHHGEEPPLSGTGGSGTVFFSYCTLRCMFCQNYQISHEGEGREYSVVEFAERMLWLQEQGCHNVNFVTPDHFLPWILRGVREAASRGVTLPIVYNCSGYQSTAALELLRDIVDIYLPDIKYADNAVARELSSAPDYVEANRAALKAMFRQVGPLKCGADGIAYRGMCIRHLVLPDGLSGSLSVLDFLTSSYDPQDITLSLMAQYRPLHRACDHPRINRRLTAAEYAPIRAAFEQAGFEGFYQEVESLDSSFVIDFTTRKHERLDGTM